VGSLVLGIDPGTIQIGYGLIRMHGGKGKAIDHGFFRINQKLPFPQRLKLIHDRISGLLESTRPDEVAIENVYVSQNAKTTLRLGHARGVIVLAVAEQDIPLAEYAPREIKQAVLGNGNASKDQVQWMIRNLLQLGDEKLNEDASDGLAVALCHAFRSSGVMRGIKRS